MYILLGMKQIRKGQTSIVKIYVKKLPLLT